MKTAIGLSVVVLVLWSFTYAQLAPDFCVGPGCDKEDCGCYVDADCLYCGGYGDCKEVGKLDGTCKSNNDLFFGVIVWDAGLSPDTLASAADYYLQAYQAAVSRGEGRPEEELIRAAFEVRLGTHNTANHWALLEVIHEVLDAALGFDFSFPGEGETFGNIHGSPAEAGALLEAVREGFVRAIIAEDPAVVMEPLRLFWADHRAYAPLHAGRYYPHGHPELDPDPFDSVSQALKLRVYILLAGRADRFRIDLPD